jgi:2-polyprenyl-3-methyl-5-hydroxy-6-metoxy-1,4-benzoquinol methylase
MVNRSDAFQYFTRSIQQEILDLMPKGISSILDIGGGDGDYAVTAKAVTGATCAAIIDISADAIKNKKSEIDFAEVCDVEELGSIEAIAKKKPDGFDLILCLDVLEHLVDPWRLISRLHAIMPHGGYLLASIPNVQNYRVLLRAACGKWHYKNSGLFDRTHLRFFGRRSAISMMTGTGLTLVTVGRAFGPKAMDRFVARATFGLIAPWVTMQNLVLVRKMTPNVADPGFYGDQIELS